MTPRRAIHTPRLALRPIDGSAAARIVSGDLTGLTPGPGWPHADTADGLLPVVASGDPAADAGWLVEHAGQVIGDCGWHGGPDEHGSVEVGFGLAAPSRGRGLGRELVGALVEWAVAQPGVRRVTAEVLLDNTASRRSLEAAGLTLDRVDDPYAYYARDAS